MLPPARLARAWAWRLPGAAMLAVERTAARVPRPALGTHDAPAVPRPAEGPAPMELLHGVRRRSALVRAALVDVQDALDADDATTAAHHVVAARTAAAPLLDSVLDAWIDLHASAVALADGAVDLAAMLSRRAAAGAQRAHDEATVLAVWWSRAARALRRGNAADGALIAGWIRPRLLELAPTLDGWSRCFEAAYHLDEGRPDAAISTCAPVLAAMPEHAPAWAAGALVSRAFFELGRTEDAARIAVATLEAAGDAPTAIRAQRYVDAGRALDAAGLDEAAARCAAVARELDPDATSAPSAVEVRGAGLELHLL